jgi:hypothetical protein
MPRARTTITAVTAVGLLGLYLWHALTPSPRAQVLAMVHVLQPCVRAVNRAVPLVTDTGPQQSSDATARALSALYAACSTAQGRLDAIPGNDHKAVLDPKKVGDVGGAYFGAEEALWQASGQDGDWREDVGFYVGQYGEGLHYFVLSAAPVLHVSPGCVAAALDWPAADADYGPWAIASPGCPRLPAILR